MRPMSRAMHGYLMTFARISPTYVGRACAITRTRRHRHMQLDINFRKQFCVFSHFTNLPYPTRLMHKTLVPSFRDRIFAFMHFLAGLQCP
jgi:hypothetical protein